MEAREVRVDAGGVVGRDLLDGKHPLARGAEPRLEGRAVVSHLLGVPAAAEAEEEAPAREDVEARDLLGQGDRIVLDAQADARADLERAGRRGRGGERDEGVERVRVLARELGPAGKGRAPARRNVGVLGDEQRLEAALLGGARQLVDADRVIRREDADAVVHLLLLGRGPGRGRQRFGDNEKWVCVASHRPSRRASAIVSRPGRAKVVPSPRTPVESQGAATQAAPSMTAPRASSTRIVKSRIRGQTWRHCSSMTRSIPSTTYATVPKAMRSGAQSRRPPSKSAARTHASQRESQVRIGASGSSLVATWRAISSRLPSGSRR